VGQPVGRRTRRKRLAQGYRARNGDMVSGPQNSDKRMTNLGGPGGLGPAATVPTNLRHGLRALRHRDFRVFMVGGLLSNSGNWLQNLTVPFVLFELTGKAVWVGLAGFAQFLPGFLFGPLGGSLADRYPRRTVLLFTQAAMAVAALMMWGAWVAEWRRPGLVLALTALTGVFSGLMVPSWQAFVPSLVPREDLGSAITLNSTQFNASRAVGPALAGVLLAVAGPAWAFFVNGLSFIAVIGALWMIRPAPVEPRDAAPLGVVAGFRDALAYTARHRGIWLGVVTAMLIAFFGNPITQFTVVFATDVYHAGPRVVGVLAAAVGVGAVLAAPVLSTWDTRISRSTTVRWGLPIYALAIVGFGLAPTWPLGLVALLVVGAGFLAVIATTNTAVQLIVADEMRGRVMAIRIMGFTLAFPLGSLAQGVAADIWSPQLAVVVFGSCLLAAAVSFSARPRLLAELDGSSEP
jgi:MFS family permease